MPTTIVLIDLSSIVYPTYHMAASDPNPDATSIQTIDRVRGLASGQPYVAVCIDSRRSIRRETVPTYKANRKAEDRAPLYHQMALAIEAFRKDGFPIWEADGYEADDIIASATARALQEPDTHVQIVSADKDLLALVSDRVTLKSLKDGSIIDTAAVVKKFGVKPEQVADYLTLVGDASDNIHGADKIGPVTASKLLTTHGTLEGIYNALMANPLSFAPSVSQSLGAFLQRVDDVRNLIRLRADLPIPFEEIAVERLHPAFDAPVVDDFSADTPTGLPSPAEPTIATDPPIADPAEPPMSTMAALKARFEAAAAAGAPIQAPPRTRKTKAVEPAPVTPPTPFVAAEAPVVEAPVVEPAAPAVEAEVVQPERPKPVAAVVSDTTTPKQWADEPAKMQAAALGQLSEGKGGALAVLEPEFTRQLEPRTMAEAIQLAKYAFESRLFGAYGSPQAVLMVAMAGREMGMQSMYALRAFHVVEGKPVLAADAIRALVLRSGKVDYFRPIQRTAAIATFAIKRKGDPEVTLSYTIEEAMSAGYVKAGSGWVKNPADMLVARASAKLARLVCPDVIHGLYAPEELEN